MECRLYEKARIDYLPQTDRPPDLEECPQRSQRNITELDVVYLTVKMVARRPPYFRKN